MSGVLRLILGDQLSMNLPSLRGADCSCDVVLMTEVMEEATYVPHHPKKIAFLFAAMRTFAQQLREQGWQVRYVPLDDPQSTGSLIGEVERAVRELPVSRVVVTEPGEYRLWSAMQDWQQRLGLRVDVLEDTRFLCSRSDFQRWAGTKKQLRMEFFYRDMRKRYGLLMEPDGTPTGGQWNYDAENRAPPQAGLSSPKRIAHPQSALTREVLTLVETHFSHHFGQLRPFYFAVSAKEAQLELDHFIDHLLPLYGTYQDAMVKGEPYLYHSLLSSYINAGLLDPLHVCRQAEAAYRNGGAPLNAVEGFVRQILGWREFIRGIYWLHMPAYGELNTLDAHEPLPAAYWGGPTHMACVREAVEHTRVHAYSHHIQRLMVTGNFALLAGLDVKAVQEWYLAVYADAYEWVEMPNTLGMALYGDGGIVGSKPYAASGKYIDRMSTFCRSCRYDPKVSVGDAACPFNSLYWDFMARHEEKLRANQRLAYVYPTWDKMGADKQRALRQQAHTVLQKMREGTL